jgi:hypothetical protein
MALEKNRTRGQARRRGERRTRRGSTNGGSFDTSLVPRVVVGTFNGVEVAAVGALRITRDVLVRAVVGAADIGAEALTATTAGVRGVLSAATRMIGDIAGTAREDLRETFSNATHVRRGAAVTLGEPPMASADSGGTSSDAAVTPRSRRRARRTRARAASRGTRSSSVAA